jgi:hypothetical protein
MSKTSQHNLLKKFLSELKSFGVIVEVDKKTFEVLGVKYPEKTSIYHNNLKN